jgi:RNA polymerase sigma-70 factor (ECF subfamily)
MCVANRNGADTPPVAQIAMKPMERAGDFERLYRSEVRSISGYFARRSSDPQTVADLTADTFLEALRSFAKAPPRRGHERAWLYGIARNVDAKHCHVATRRNAASVRHANRRSIDDDETEQIHRRIDAEASGRDLLEQLRRLSACEREAIELVELSGLTPREAATVAGVAPELCEYGYSGREPI